MTVQQIRNELKAITATVGQKGNTMDNKKYYYLKLKEDFFESDSMILLENMRDGYLYSNILLKLYLRSLKDDGRLMLNGAIPYNSQMLASVTRHQVGTVEKALNVFQDLGLIEVLDSGAIYMMDIQNFVGESSNEADRKRAYRARIEKDKCPDKNPTNDQTNLHQRIEYRDKSIENRYIGVCAQAELDDTQTHTKKKKTTRFVPPTVEEVKQYCEENNYKLDAQRFVDFYESKGWMIGKNKMKSWQAAVRTWTRKAKEGTKQDEEDRGESTSVRLW